MSNEPKLYSYVLRIDDGAAPNPFGGTCTLAICKPAIRRTANIGDWIVGLGSKTENGRDGLSRHMIYAMKVSKTVDHERYDALCSTGPMSIKRPIWCSDAPFVRQVGDCLYDFSDRDDPQQRPGVHLMGNMKADLSGNVLLSEHFYYFGDNPVELHGEFAGISHPNQGHKVWSNRAVAITMIPWLENGCGGRFKLNALCGLPMHRSRVDPSQVVATWKTCGNVRQTEGDEEVNDREAICE